jgi:hypothetical protein
MEIKASNQNGFVSYELESIDFDEIDLSTLTSPHKELLVMRSIAIVAIIFIAAFVMIKNFPSKISMIFEKEAFAKNPGRYGPPTAKIKDTKMILDAMGTNLATPASFKKFCSPDADIKYAKLRNIIDLKNAWQMKYKIAKE